MSSSALKSKITFQTDGKRLALKERFSDPKEILNLMADYIKDGDVASLTDLISSYIANCPKYNNHEEFAVAIWTTRQTLHRMLSHNDAVSIKVFFAAIERIYSDASEVTKKQTP